MFILSGLTLYSDVANIDDEDAERKLQAEVLLNAYSRELERRRSAATSSGLTIGTEGEAFH